MTQNVCLQNIYITIVPFLSCIVCIFIRLLQHCSQQKRVSHIAIIVENIKIAMYRLYLIKERQLIR